jgi:GGDEF domain-containing protein
MNTQTQLYQAFARDFAPLTDLASAKDAWLIKGDFDRFKMINNLYGCLITDCLLDGSVEVVAATLAAYELHRGVGPILWHMVGDDVTIYIPPSTLTADDVAHLLHDVRSAIQGHFRQRFAVSALPFPAGFFADVPPGQLEELKYDLARRQIAFDFAPRQQGCLTLFPLAWGGRHDRIAGEMNAAIQRCLGKRRRESAARWAWLFDPAENACQTFNDGFIYPPSLSLAGYSARRMLAESTREMKAAQSYERLSSVCQAALKICKLRRCGVVVNDASACSLAVDSLAGTSPAEAEASGLRWMRERELRERLYFRQFAQPSLFQVNPVYRFASGAHADCLHLEKYRGNVYGVGLKGINELCGQTAADGVIAQLRQVFGDILSAALARKGYSPDFPLMSLFVDRFTVFGERPLFSLAEIVTLGRQLMAGFNRASQEIQVAHVRISLADGPHPLAGYALLHRLTFTQLTTCPAAVAYADEKLEVRRFCDAAACEGRLVIEQDALLSARHLPPVEIGGYNPETRL